MTDAGWVPEDVVAAYWAGCPVAQKVVVEELSLALAIRNTREHLVNCRHTEPPPAPAQTPPA